MEGELTLSVAEIHEETGISVRALLKYKHREAVEGGALWPYVRGEGKYMRFTEDAIPIFYKLRNRGLYRRGRPRQHTQADHRVGY